MKKILSFICAVATLFAFASCAGESDVPAVSEPPESAPESVPESSESAK